MKSLSIRDARAGRSAIALLVLIALAVLFFFPLIFLGRVYYAGDFSDQNYPWRAFTGESWRAGRIPLWIPYLRSGFPLAAELQVGVFYLPNLLHAALPLPASFAWLYALHLALAGIFMFLFLRELGLSRLSATFGGVSYAFGAPIVSRMVWINFVESAAWLPLLLLLAERAARTGRYGRLGIWAGLVFGVQTISGHPELSLYSAAGLLVYVLARRPAPMPRRLMRAAGFWLLAVGLGAGVAAIQVIPTAQLLGLSERPAVPGSPLRYGFDFPLSALATLAAPTIYGSPGSNTYFGDNEAFEVCAYVGLVALVLGLATMWRGGDDRVRALTILALISVSVALSHHFPTWLLLIAAGLYLARGDLAARRPPAKAVEARASAASRRKRGAPPVPEAAPRPAAPVAWASPRVMAAGVLIVLGLIAFVFRATVPTPGLLYAIPPFSSFQFPTRLMLVFGLALAALAAIGLDRLLREPAAFPFFRSPWVFAPAAAALGLAGAAAAVLGVWPAWVEDVLTGAVRSGPVFSVVNWCARNFADSQERYLEAVSLPTVVQEMEQAYAVSLSAIIVFAALLTVLAALLWARSRGRLGGPAFGIAVIGLTVMDLFLFGLPYNPTTTPGFYDRPKIVAAMPGVDRDFRFQRTQIEGFSIQVFPDRRLRPWLRRGWPPADQVRPWLESMPWDLPALWRIYSFEILTPLGLSDLRTLRIDSETYPSARVMSSVRYVITGVEATPEAPAIIMERDARPRAYVVSAAVFPGDDDATLARLRSPEFVPNRQVALQPGPRPAILPAPGPAASPARPARITQDLGNEVTVQAETAEAAVLVLTDTDYPGWQAWVDGRPARIYRANYAFRAVVLSPGRHEVVFRFQPRSLRIGAGVSLVAILGAFGTLFAFPGRRRPSVPPEKSERTR